WQMLGFNKHYVVFDLPYMRSQPEFHIEKQIVLLVTHHGVTNIWQRIYYINDLYFLLARYDINWDWLMAELRRYGFEGVFLAGLYWCQEIWSFRLPDSIKPLVDQLITRRVAEEYAENWTNKKSYEFSDAIVRQLKFLAKTQTNLSGKAKVYRTFLTSRVFQPSLFNVGGSYIYIPKELGFMTVFIRAVQSLLRFLPAKSDRVSKGKNATTNQNVESSESSQSVK
ncbi:MAG: nucleotidyltransferase family protein, partial [Spirosoma sp.]|nr:nucleotidyltransferase family protein [Spirosoma sp.]